MINSIIRLLWGRTDNGWLRAVGKRRNFLLKYGSPKECQLFLSRLKCQGASLQPTVGDDDPYFSCKEDEGWRQSLQARRRFIFAQTNKDDDGILNDYSSFSGHIDEQIKETKEILAHKLEDVG